MYSTLIYSKTPDLMKKASLIAFFAFWLKECALPYQRANCRSNSLPRIMTITVLDCHAVRFALRNISP